MFILHKTSELLNIELQNTALNAIMNFIHKAEQLIRRLHLPK